MHKKYVHLQPNFCCFPLPKMVLGIEFSSKTDAKLFHLLVNKYCPKIDADSDQDAFIYDVKEKQGMEPIEHMYISRPQTFTLADTKWFNPLTETFNIDEIPKEVKNLIKEIGYKKKDLKNRETAKKLYETLKKFGLDA